MDLQQPLDLIWAILTWRLHSQDSCTSTTTTTMLNNSSSHTNKHRDNLRLPPKCIWMDWRACWMDHRMCEGSCTRRLRWVTRIRIPITIRTSINTSHLNLITLIIPCHIRSRRLLQGFL